MRKVFHSIQALPQELSMSQYQCVKKGLKLMTSLLHPANNCIYTSFDDNNYSFLFADQSAPHFDQQKEKNNCHHRPFKY